MQLKAKPIYSALITGVSPQGLAAELGLQPGDELVAVNGHALRDVIDVQFYSAEEFVELLVRRDEEMIRYEAERDYDQPLGIEFAHPTFDVDIRRCNNLCEFCFVLQTPPRMRRTLYIKDDDYRYSFLHGHFVTLTNLSDEDWARIEEQHLSPLYISVHATELELRRRVLRNAGAPDVMAQLRWLSERDIEIHTQIVVTPGLNDKTHLDRSIADLADLWPSVRSVSVVPVGITKYHKYGRRPNTLAEARTVYDQVSAWQRRFMTAMGVRFAYLTDEWYLVLEEPVPPAENYDGLALQENGLGQVRGFLDGWQLVKAKLAAATSPVLRIERSRNQTRGKEQTPESAPKGDNALAAGGRVKPSGGPDETAAGARWPATHDSRQSQSNRITLVTGALFARTLEQVAAAFSESTGTACEVVPVVNQRLGETITVAGLLMGQDVIDQLQERELGDLVILPRAMFDHPDRIALDDLGPDQIAQALRQPVILAEGMNDVWKAVLSGK